LSISGQPVSDGLFRGYRCHWPLSLDKPVTGGMEIQELMMVLIVFMAMGIVTRDKAHVFVELL
jgi:hypothetical protein